MASAAAAVLSLIATGPLTPAPATDLRGARLFKSGPIQITADGASVWCVNPDNDSVSRLGTASGLVTEFPLPGGTRHKPQGLSLTEDGSEIWVACHDSDRVYVLAGADGAVLARIDLPWGSGPFSVALAPDQRKALVTLHRGEGLAALDVPGRHIARLLPHVFWAPMGIAWAENGQAAWVNHIFSPGEHPLQTRVDFSGDEPRVSTMMRILPADPRQSSRLAAPYNVAEGGYLNIRGHPAQIPMASGRTELWLPTQYHNMTEDTPTPDSIVQSVVRHLHLPTRTLLTANADKVIMTALHVHQTTGSGAYLGPGWNAGVAGPIDLGFSIDGTMAFVLNELSRDLVFLPVNTPNQRPTNAPPLTQVKLGDRPIGLALSPVTSNAFVLNLLSRDVSVVDLAARTELRRVPITPVTGERFLPAVLLGARIFHRSDDPRISRSGKMACASCHLNAEHDGRTWANDKLPGPHGPRATQSLLGLRQSAGPRDPITGFGQFHRSGDRDEIQDFEHTFQGAQMGGTGFLGNNALPELGAPNAGRSPELDALASYLLSLDPLARSPHRAPGGALTEPAIRGATFFLGANRTARRGDAHCADCHVPETAFCDLKFHDVGQRRDAAEHELNNRAPAWSVNTPSLVGAWASAPYVGGQTGSEAHHAAEAMTALLRDAAPRANTITNHGRPDGLTARQLRDLAEFVLSIDGNLTAAEARAARDVHPPRITRVEPAGLRRIEVWFSETVKSNSAVSTAHYLLTTSTGTVVPIVSVQFDPQNGDRVTLFTFLQPHTRYQLAPVGGIVDDADAASGGVANVIDPADPANRHSFALDDRLRVTLGASGYEHFTIPVHDAAMAGPNLATWSHDSAWLFPVSGGPGFNTAFIRFDWAGAFRTNTGVTNAGAIVAATLRLHPAWGDSQTIQARRCLQRWSDPSTGGDFNSSATGAPTWNSSAHGTRTWNQPGAARLGGNGTLTNDYFGTNDLAARVDATARMTAINEPFEFDGPLITDAFRFWFANPAFDFGYALRLAAGSSQETRFERWEQGFREDGPVLELTYLLPGAAPRLEARATPGGVRLQWPVEHSGFALESSASPETGWALHGATAATNATWSYVDVLSGSPQRFFRLTRP